MSCASSEEGKHSIFNSDFKLKCSFLQKMLKTPPTAKETQREGSFQSWRILAEESQGRGPGTESLRAAVLGSPFRGQQAKAPILWVPDENKRYNAESHHSSETRKQITGGIYRRQLKLAHHGGNHICWVQRNQTNYMKSYCALSTFYCVQPNIVKLYIESSYSRMSVKMFSASTIFTKF